MDQKGTGEAGSRLRTEYDRVRDADPFQVLGLTPNAELTEVRIAFLQRVKRYHPQKFARETRETRALANELFLLIRRAYDVLCNDQKRQGWRERIGTGQVAPTTQVNPIVPPAPSKKVIERATRAATTAPAAAPLSAPSPPRPAGNPPRREPATPPAVSFRGRSRHITDVNAVLEQAKTRGQRFEEAQRLLAQGQWQAAREAFQKIATEDSQSRRYRSYLCYARGLEHRACGRIEEAIKELERAVALDPDGEAAEFRNDLDKTREMKKGGGLFSKIFGR
jgi:curved DNA-binding protein CbpA